ncbi:MAG: Ig-like domain-containing protein, partial [Acidobacteria bacterium]|nr:Ig-like domain-containing protein [Acidobacteriota bacterium]
MWILAVLTWAGAAWAADIAVSTVGRTCKPTEVLVYAGDTVTWWWGDGPRQDVASWDGDWQSPVSAPPMLSPVYSRQFDTAGTSVYVARQYDINTNLLSKAGGTITVLPREAGRPAALINAPRDGAHFSAGETVPLLASVYDPPGETPAVEFFANGVSIGSVATPPYSLQWTNAPAGTNVVICRLSGVAGETIESPPVRIVAVAGRNPVLASPRIMPGGLFAFDYTEQVRRFYRVRSSTDLQNWQVAWYYLNSGTYIEVNRANEPHLFYRLEIEPTFAAQAQTGPPRSPRK